MQNPFAGKSFAELTTLICYALLTTLICYAFQAMTPSEKDGTIMMLAQVHCGAPAEETFAFMEAHAEKRAAENAICVD